MRHRRLIVGALLVGGALAGGGVGIAAVAGAEDGEAPVTAAWGGTTTTSTAPAPTTTSPPTTVADAVGTLPVPEAPPEDAYADVPVVEIGRIRIAAIGLDHVVHEGVWLTVIDNGPGHWPGTALPGGEGNAVFAGHRVTHSHPFRDLDLLQPGDSIIFAMNDGGVYEYAVTEQLVVSPKDLWIVDQAPGHTLTLFACHPKGSARQRIVIRAELVSPVSAPEGPVTSSVS